MFCMDCGKVVPTDAAFCPSCGKSAVDEVSQRDKAQAAVVGASGVGAAQSLSAPGFRGKLEAALSRLDDKRAFIASLVFVAVFEICVLLSVLKFASSLRQAFPLGSSATETASPDLGGAEVFRLIALGLLPFVSSAAALALARLALRGSGSIGRDAFTSGASLLPLGLLMLIGSFLGIGNLEVVGVLCVFAICYTISILFIGCTRLSNISDAGSAFAVPFVLLVSAYICKVVVASAVSPSVEKSMLTPLSLLSMASSPQNAPSLTFPDPIPIQPSRAEEGLDQAANFPTVPTEMAEPTPTPERGGADRAGASAGVEYEGSQESPAGERYLKQGMEGSDVRRWQEFLISQGHMEPPALGTFSTRTRQGTIAFQKKRGLYADGEVGPRTREKARELELDAPTTPTNLSFTSYSDEGSGWSLDYPEGWSVSTKNYDDGRRRVEIASPSPNIKAIVDVSPGQASDAAQDWLSLDGRYSKTYGSRYRRIALAPGTLSGEPSARWEFTLQKKGEPKLQKIDYGTSYAGDGYAVLFQAPAEDFESWRDAFDRMHRSFRFGG